MPHDQCPECYGYDVAPIKSGNLFLWLGMSLGVSAVLFFVVFSGVVENVIPWIVGLVIVDLLITIPLMASLRSRSQYGGATYRCRECGHTWSEAQAFSQEASPLSTMDYAAMSPSITPPMGASATGFRMTVQDVFSIKGRGTVVTGIVEAGVVTKGMTLEIHSQSGITQTVVDGVEMFRKVTEQAVAGDNVGLLLRNVPHDAVKRGDVLRGIG